MDYRTLISRAKTGLAALLVASTLFMSAPQSAKAIPVVETGMNLIQSTISAVSDTWEITKEGVLDALASTAAKAAIRSILRSTINWANNGFEGSPAYVTNLRDDMRRLADLEADRFLDQLGVSEYIDSPFRNSVVSGLRSNYLRSTSNRAFFESSRYTLSDYAMNDEEFARGNMSQGGLSAWVEAWRNDQNNVFGAFRSAREELERSVRDAVGSRQTELSWSNGVLSWCAEPAQAGEAPQEEGPVDLTPPPAGGSSDCQIETPGSFIHERITDSLGADIASLVSADELDEVVSALLNGLANKILEEGGFAGLSRPSAGGGPSPVDAAQGTTYGTTTSARTIGNIGTQIGQMEDMKENWERILSVAETAEAACEDSSRDGSDESTELARTTIEEARAAIARAEGAADTLEDIRTRLRSAGTSSTQELRATYEEYETFIQSDEYPSASELTRASIESQDTEGSNPSLYTRLVEARQACGRIF